MWRVPILIEIYVQAACDLETPTDIIVAGLPGQYVDDLKEYPVTLVGQPPAMRNGLDDLGGRAPAFLRSLPGIASGQLFKGLGE